MDSTSHVDRKRSQDVHEKRLLERVVARDRLAFEQLFYAYHPRLHRFVTRMVKHAWLADEIVNDVMLVIWRGAKNFAGNSSVSTWIFGIAYRISLKRLRKRRLMSLFVHNDVALEQASHDGGYGLSEQREWLKRGFDQLSPSQRAVVELSYYSGYGYAEIGEILDCPENTVKTRMFHARRKLKRVLPVLERDDVRPRRQTK